MPIPPRGREPDPPPEGAVEPSCGDLMQPGPPTEEAEPGPDASTGTAAPNDEDAAALREAEDRWRRALADLDNQRKRHAREVERVAGAERARTAAAFLPVIDNLELALSHAGAADPGAIVEGVRAVRDQAVNVLERLGYPRHAETGVAFDPARHEVVGVVQDPDADPNTVVQVLRPGYGEAERQLRPAAVTVAKRE
ncbi:nucleotide exchange factor GrpE [Streptomyces sp. NBC_00539]|uniref:nucleotide exchange factor GrpE n=1 Tax=Streptomyces sp. NBC_00539 TaxID=2975770 RepID=UPI002E809C94|nr:nucleotide exchange factor GrpE [Streptomyces sp. NBC_00539]WUC62951.1 nucleotide exchange factor GrpE [Streptomyces sp. NBC_00539]